MCSADTMYDTDIQLYANLCKYCHIHIYTFNSTAKRADTDKI